MKKLLLSCLMSIIMAASVFAASMDFFSHRIVEIKLDVPVGASNNVLGVGDIFTKNLFIDLGQFADSLPNNGLNVSFRATPSVGFTIDIPNGLILGARAGVDLIGTIGTSKDFYNFFGHGYSIGDKVKLDMLCNIDAFAYTQTDFGWHLDELTFIVQPTVFASVAHVVSDKSYVSLQNTEDGKFIADVKGRVELYSDLSEDEIQNKEYNQAANYLFPGAGFDLSGTVKYDLFDFLSVTGFARIPLVPSRLNSVTVFEFEKSFELDIDTLLNNPNEGGEDNTGNSGNNSSDEETGKTYDVDYFINRPMKFTVGVDFHPFGNLMSYYGSFGLGFKHPFAENKMERGVYVDYLAGLKLSLAGIISMYLTTERTDEIYRHKAMAALSLRLIEIDVGAALESASFANSFKGTGAGIFVTGCIGF